MIRLVHRARIEQYGCTAEVGVHSYTATALEATRPPSILAPFKIACLFVTGEALSRSCYPLQIL